MKIHQTKQNIESIAQHNQLMKINKQKIWSWIEKEKLADFCYSSAKVDAR